MGEGERYREFAPPPALRPFVRLIWTYAAPAPEPVVQRIAPDGCPELILDIGAPYEEQGDDGVFRLQPRALFAGQMTRPLALRPVGPVELVAVRFEPDGARDWLERPLAEATDRRLDMTGRLAGVAAPAGDPLAVSSLLTTAAGGVAPIFVGAWGAVDVIRDPYTDAQSGGLRITALATMDVTVARPAQLEILTGLQIASGV